MGARRSRPIRLSAAPCAAAVTPSERHLEDGSPTGKPPPLRRANSARHGGTSVNERSVDAKGALSSGV